MTRRPAPLLFLALTAALFSAGCGAGTAGIVSSSSDNGGSNSSPSIANLEVPVSRTAPGRIHVELSDREGQSVRLELSARVPLAGGGLGDAEILTAVSGPGFPANGASVTIPGGNQALALELEWRFPDEAFPDWPDDGRFVEGIQLLARLSSGAQFVLGDDEALSLGNDAPVVTAATPIIDPDEGEAAGIVRVEVTVEDSSDDVVTVLPEFDVQGDVPDAGWQPATGFGLTDVRVSRAGTTLDFFWETDTDLHDLERQVALRFTATDFSLVGAAFSSVPFRIDNNAAPIVQLFNDAVLANPDERRGIPVPFRVFDEEGDLVEVIFQWRREGEEFPPLAEAEIDTVLADPVLRRERHICTEYPRFAHGLVVPIDATTVRLPELARSESWILASGLVGRSLELLRPSSTFEPITPTWGSNPLVAPIAVLPVDDGLTALVLDAPGNGRLREIELATGAIVREIASLGPGAPSAMALERGERAVLVATDLSGVWRIERVELASGAITELVVSEGSQPGPVHGIASLGTNVAAFTAGSALFSLDYRDPLAPQIGTLLAGLASPWGIVVDPLPPNRLYLAEREAVTPSGTGRVLAIELDSHEELPVVVRTEDLQPAHLERPSALALERHGSRMLIVTNAPGSGSQLVGLDLGAQGRNVSFPIGPPRASEIASIATGPDELRCAGVPGEHELLIGGGLEQRRAIVAYDSAGQEAIQDAAFQPEARPGHPWRIPAEPRLLASPAGLEAAFVWSSGSDVPGGGPAFVRAIARDDELGLATEGRAPKQVRTSLDVAPLVLGGPAITTPYSVAAADLDGDGDQDLVSANLFGDTLTVFFQGSPGSFASAPLVLGGPATTNGPISVMVADLDGDGDQDLVSANREGDNLTVFFQGSPGSFAAAPLVLGGFTITDAPRSVAAADLDGDGDQDLVSANEFGDTLTVFFQGSPGSFGAAPLVLGGSATTNLPVSVSAADLDGDGDQDLVSANRNGNNLTVFFQGSPGSFAAAPLVLGGSAITRRPVFVAAADLDGDGDQDLVSANEFGDTLPVFFQGSPGSFAVAPVVLGGPAITNGPRSVAAADLDGDGDQDLVSANAEGSTLTVFFQGSPGSFAAAPLVLGGPAITNFPSSVAAADLDGDGDQDLVSANENGSNLTVFFQGSPGSFAAAPLVLGGFAITSSPRSVAAADLDADGDQDLVSANYDSSTLTVFFQLAGSFASAPLVLGGSGTTRFPVSVVAADLDGDGDQDLVSGSASVSPPSRLMVFFQSSAGRFDPTPLALGPHVMPVSVAAADLDGDGDQDLVSANALDNSLRVFFQNSPGSFNPTPLLLGNSRMNAPNSVAAADLDGDGDQDLVSANIGSDNLTVFFQGLPGGFASTPRILGGPGTTDDPRYVVAADLDGDGDQDLVSANVSTMTVFIQTSPGSFAAAPLVLGGPGTIAFAYSVAVADLDGDGDQDLISANSVSDNLTVFFQTSPGSFAAAPLVLGGPGTTSGSRSVAAADLDGDGDQDLVSANDFGHNLTVFWGGR